MILAILREFSVHPPHPPTPSPKEGEKFLFLSFPPEAEKIGNLFRD